MAVLFCTNLFCILKFSEDISQTATTIVCVPFRNENNYFNCRYPYLVSMSTMTKKIRICSESQSRLFLYIYNSIYI